MKRTITTLIAVLLSLCLLWAPGALALGESPASSELTAASAEPVGTSAEPGLIGILSAMDSEISLLLDEAEIDSVETVGGVDYHLGTLRGVSVVIARSGIGKVLAAAGMTAMLNRYPVTAVIFTGIAGGVGDETQVLDEVIATRLVQHDYGVITGDGFQWAPASTQTEIGEDGYFPCDPALVDLAYEAAVRVLGPEHVFTGTIATGDQFVSSEAYVKILQQNFDAIACEMEGAAVASVCWQYDVPFVVIRAMSDKADGLAHETIRNMGGIAADNSCRIVLEILASL